MSRRRRPPLAMVALLAALAMQRLAAQEALGLSLEQAARSAVEHSAELALARRQLELRSSLSRTSFVEWLPTIAVEAGEGDLLDPNGPDNFQKNWSLTFSQRVWDGGRSTLQRRSERALLELERMGLARKVRELEERARRAYREVLSRRAALSIRRSTIAFLQDQLSILDTERREGLARELDWRQASLEVAKAELQRTAEELRVRAAERELCRLIDQDELPPLCDALDPELPGVAVDAAWLEGRLLECNLELAESRLRVAMTRQAASAILADWFPDLRLELAAELRGDSYPLHEWAASATLSLDFSGPFLKTSGSASLAGRSAGTLAASASGESGMLFDAAALGAPRERRLQADSARENHLALVSSLERRLAELLEDHELAALRRDMAKSALALAREQLELEEARLELGLNTRLDLVAARLSMEEAELELLAACAELLSAEQALEALADLDSGALRRRATGELGGCE